MDGDARPDLLRGRGDGTAPAAAGPAGCMDPAREVRLRIFQNRGGGESG